MINRRLVVFGRFTASRLICVTAPPCSGVQSPKGRRRRSTAPRRRREDSRQRRQPALVLHVQLSAMVCKKLNDGVVSLSRGSVQRGVASLVGREIGRASCRERV